MNIEKKAALIELLQQYLPLGQLSSRKSGELLLHPEDALCLADDLAALSVVNLGLDGWRYVGKGQEGIQQDLGVDFTVPEAVLRRLDAAQKSASLVKEYIKKHLAQDTVFVSFTLDVPLDWDLFPER